MSKIKNDKNNYTQVKSECSLKKKYKCIGIGFSILTGIAQIFIFGISAYISSIGIAETFITIMMKQILAAGLQGNLISDGNIMSLIAGWCAPALFMILATVILWGFVMYKYWQWLSKVFGGWRKANVAHFLAKAESCAKE